MPTATRDRRSATRYALSPSSSELTITYEENGTWKPAVAAVKDISLTGIRFTSPAQLPLKKLLNLRLAATDLPTPIEAKGMIQWAENPSGYDNVISTYGLEFHQLDKIMWRILADTFDMRSFRVRAVADRRQKVESQGNSRREGTYFDRETRLYCLDTDVTFGYTSAAANAYFARYFDWQGFIREKWLFKYVPDWMEKLAAVRQITYHAETFYKYPVYFGDNVSLRIGVKSLTKTKLVFRFVFVKLIEGRDGPVFAEGTQTILFGHPNPNNPIESKIGPVPECIRVGCKDFLPSP